MKVRANLAVTAASAMLAVAFMGCSNPPTNTGAGGTTGQTGGSTGQVGGSTGTGGDTTPAGGTSGGGTGGTTTPTGGTGGTTTPTGGTGGTPTGGSGGTPTGGTGGTPTGGSGGATGGAGGNVTTGACGTCPAGVEGHCDANATYPTYPGFELALVEDFCQPIDLTTDKVWTYSDGAPADGDTWFDKSQITFSGGKMMLTAIKQTIPANYVSYSESDANSMVGHPTGRHFLSGEFRSKYNNYRYGRYEVNYKTPVAVPTGPATAGGYLSTMFAFRTPKWINWNEIDLELEPADGNTSILKEVAGNVVNFANAVPPTGVPGYPGGAAFDADPMNPSYVQTDFHTYAFEWTTAGIKWYADGKNIHSYAGGNGNGGGNPKLPNLSAKIMMNLWIFGGTHFGDPSPNVYPMHSEYEYFRFYKATGETYPCSPTPSCISTADANFSKNNKDETTYP